jgi:hypothetical protein
MLIYSFPQAAAVQLLCLLWSRMPAHDRAKIRGMYMAACPLQGKPGSSTMAQSQPKDRTRVTKTCDPGRIVCHLREE